ncbi:helix-turn-helix domain-containing protein [Brevundimonas aurifodinae]|uniref:Helix-turn-helix domain-containing protein n=1 Tax=Brevundimonas aurifodinae TaxID=1508312 RepID=A0ABV1NKB4_9CAUL
MTTHSVPPLPGISAPQLAVHQSLAAAAGDEGAQTATAVEALETPVEAASTTKSAMEERWGKNVIKAGYTVVPSIILRAQARLHINAVELAVLLHLLDHWWDNAEMPFPSKQRIADRLDVSTKTVQRAAAKLEAEGLVRRVKRSNGHGGQASNHYDLSPLIEKIRPIADEYLEANRKASELRRSVGRNGGLKSWASREALGAKGAAGA